MATNENHRVLAYTVSHGNRPHLAECVPAMRGAAGEWFDWAVFLGRPSERLMVDAQSLLNQPGGLGIQYLLAWKENRGQHHATTAALELAREKGYDWLLRIDDDVTPRTQRWLKKMLKRADDIKERTEDDIYRFVLCPKIIGLKHPVQPIGVLEKGQKYDVEILPVAGGALRLHPVALLRDYKPPLYEPVGRGDPTSIAAYLEEVGGFLARFKDIRVVHNTAALEEAETPHESHERAMGKYWPFLGGDDAE